MYKFYCTWAEIVYISVNKYWYYTCVSIFTDYLQIEWFRYLNDFHFLNYKLHVNVMIIETFKIYYFDNNLLNAMNGGLFNLYCLTLCQWLAMSTHVCRGWRLFHLFALQLSLFSINSARTYSALFINFDWKYPLKFQISLFSTII